MQIHVSDMFGLGLVAAKAPRDHSPSHLPPMWRTSALRASDMKRKARWPEIDKGASRPGALCAVGTCVAIAVAVGAARTAATRMDGDAGTGGETGSEAMVASDPPAPYGGGDVGVLVACGDPEAGECPLGQRHCHLHRCAPLQPCAGAFHQTKSS